MNSQWPTAKLGDVLRRSEEAIKPAVEAEYREITVRLWGQGVIERGRVTGASVSGRRFVAHAGQFIASRIDARNGAMGIVPPSLEGAVVTNDFPLFNVNTAQLEAAFLGWLCRTSGFVELCLRASEGTTNRVRLKEDRFLALNLPLPRLADQRRIVARIEELAARIQEARNIQHKSEMEVDALIPSATASLLDDAGWPISPLSGILAEKPRNGLGPQREVDSGGRGMLRINAVSSSPTRYVDMTAVKQVEVAEEIATQFVIRRDDVFIVRYNGDINRVGKAAIYKGDNESHIVYPDKLIRLRSDSSKMIPDFLVFALSSRTVRAQIESLGKTTAGNIGISGGDARSFIIPIPPLPEQHRIVAKLDGLRAEVDALKRLQAETAAELDAFLPSVLSKAFAGEL